MSEDLSKNKLEIETSEDEGLEPEKTFDFENLKFDGMDEKKEKDEDEDEEAYSEIEVAEEDIAQVAEEIEKSGLVMIKDFDKKRTVNLIGLGKALLERLKKEALVQKAERKHKLALKSKPKLKPKPKKLKTPPPNY